MTWIPLLLAALVVFFSENSAGVGAPMEVMSAPSLLRVGSNENIFVEIQDCQRQDSFDVQIYVKNHPTKNTVLSSTTVTLSKAGNYQGLGRLKLSAANLNNDPKVKQYVTLQAQFPGRLLEKVVLVSFQLGYIFIQTDKTIYTPNSEVRYRVFALRPNMEPVESANVPETESSVVIEIMTPGGIVVESQTVSLTSGMKAATYTIPDIVSMGQWKVVAKFQSNPQQSFFAEFEVKEYVLPSFEVKLSVQGPPFFYVDSDQLTVNIKATYVFGKKVDGTAYVVFGIIDKSVKKGIPSSLQRVAVVNGQGTVTLRKEDIIQTFPNINELEESSIYVAVSVLTQSGGEMVESELRGIQIVSSPYKIMFKKTAKYFKPGMSFDLMVEVSNPDGTPAKGVIVVVEPGKVQVTTGGNGLAKATINPKEKSILKITVKTSQPGIPSDRQASAFMEAQPYQSNSQTYLHISADTLDVEMGGSMRVTLFLNKPESLKSDITFLILSRGQVMRSYRFENNALNQISQMIEFTKDMLPSFRILAYYHTSGGELVSDSVWVNVDDICMGTLKLEVMGSASSYEPRRSFKLKITGDTGATVGLVAVDKSVYVLNDKNQLTQKKIWETVEKYDPGCTAGGGENNMKVFYDAGLLLETSNLGGTPDRTVSECPTSRRRKRASTIMDVRTSLCERDDGYTDRNEITTRTNFPESWYWTDVSLTCPPTNKGCKIASLERTVPLPDSITTWQMTGISLSQTHSICVAKPLEVIVWKPFFIDLRLPYAAVQGEQLEVKAILHNYDLETITVRVELKEDSSACSAAYKKGWFQQEVQVGPETTRSVPFIIIPMKSPELSIEIKASVKNSYRNDGIKKTLRVVPPGVLVKSPFDITLDPGRKGGKQVETIKSEINPLDLVPNTPSSTLVSLTGIEQMSSLFEYGISGESMGSLIQEPDGCGEQNMIGMTLPVIATSYLDKTNRWEDVGFEKRDKALGHIKSGFNKELAFRKNDGSFTIFQSWQSTTWLTAYVTKVFSIAYSLVVIDRSVICDAVKFLILNTQQPDGVFVEIGSVYEKHMIGDVGGVDSDASMTAFCLIAMQESQTLCSSSVNSLPNSIQKATSYLERRLPQLTNPYAVAMTSYALANENKLKKEILFKFAAQDRSHWPVEKGDIFTLEATAYALLALVKAEDFENAKSVVRWLSQRQKVGGGYGSTQATIMVYQAVAAYWTNAREPPYNMNVDILLPGKSLLDKYKINQQNHYQARTDKEQEKQFSRYKNTERSASMTILDIGLPTGYTFNKNDLESLSSGHAPIISNYETDQALSEKGSLIIYLKKVSNTRPEEISFRIEQEMKVGVLQPAAVSIYEYYNKKRCVKFYRPERGSGELLILSVDDVRVCAEESCTKQKKENIDNEQRATKACESTATSKIDFVYKVRVEHFKAEENTDMYSIRILEVIKVGTKDPAPGGKLRRFISYQHCRDALDLKETKTYLIMGSSSDIYKDGDSFQYLLGENTWVEYWPAREECQNEKYRPTCLGMELLIRRLDSFGCEMK
ncbi:complement C3-like [Odontesthes bonariensis]